MLLERERWAVDALDGLEDLLYRLLTVVPARIVVEQDVLDVTKKRVVQEALVLLATDVSLCPLAPAA